MVILFLACFHSWAVVLGMSICSEASSDYSESMWYCCAAHMVFYTGHNFCWIAFAPTSPGKTALLPSISGSALGASTHLVLSSFNSTLRLTETELGRAWNWYFLQEYCGWLGRLLLQFIVKQMKFSRQRYPSFFFFPIISNCSSCTFSASPSWALHFHYSLDIMNVSTGVWRQSFLFRIQQSCSPFSPSLPHLPPAYGSGWGSACRTGTDVLVCEMLGSTLGLQS